MGQLLPQVTRGSRLSQWPSALPVAVELDYALMGAGWTIDGLGPVDALDFHVDDGEDRPPAGFLRLVAAVAEGDERPRVVWRGVQDVLGIITPEAGDLLVRRGFGIAQPLGELLTAHPPTIFFL